MGLEQILSRLDLCRTISLEKEISMIEQKLDRKKGLTLLFSKNMAKLSSYVKLTLIMMRLGNSKQTYPLNEWHRFIRQIYLRPIC